MTTPTITRESVDAAPPLTFDEAPVEYHYPQITLSCVVQHRGRAITVTAADMNADQFCDLLDKRFGQPTEHPAPANGTPTGEAPVCPIHAPRKMKVSNYGGWFCTWTDPTTGEKCKEKVK